MTASPPPIGAVLLEGTPTLPTLIVEANSYQRIPTDGLQVQEWVKSLPGRYWDRERSRWVVTGVGEVANIELMFADVGLPIRYPTCGPLSGWRAQDLITPVANVDADDASLLRVRHRLLGWEQCRDRLGYGAIWSKHDEWFELPVMDATVRGQLRAGVVWPEGTFERSLASKQPPNLREDLRRFAAAVSNATDMSMFGGRDALSEWVSLLPDWFGRGNPDDAVITPFDYQILGAIGCVLGHGMLADEPGVGKTVTSLAVAAIRKSTRTVVVCPPLLVSNWVREATIANIARRGGERDGSIVAIVPGRKAPELPVEGVVVVPDSTLAARPELVQDLCEWGPSMMIYDEAHRAMSLGSKRSRAALRLSRASTFTLPVTGTPMLSGPQNLAPLFEMTGHLGWLFDGRGPFLERFCWRDKYGNFTARKRELSTLGGICAADVWVRRLKHDVLPQLPAKFRSELPVRVKLTDYRKAHRDVIGQVDAWIANVREEHGRTPTAQERDAFVEGSLSLISQLRQAAGVCKIPAAVEFIELHDFDECGGKYGRPLIVWTHHQGVTDGVSAAVAKLGLPFGVIRGGTPAEDRDALVAGFQDGQFAVLVCSITAAGVGITLTRSQDVLFVETDWTPALVLQAEDRCHRVGQTSNVSYTTLVAPDTLDEHIQHTLHKKGMVLGAVLRGSADVSVSQADGLQTARDILAGLLEARLQRNSQN